MINRLIEQNPHSFTIEYNDHKGYYQDVIETITEVEQGDLSEVDCVVLGKIKETNTWIWIRVYYQTPISFFDVHHYDLEKAIDIAVEEMKDFNDRKKKWKS